ncbi:MAG: hypothetical protein AABW88_04215 [Nanoarchaeota archaeon]
MIKQTSLTKMDVTIRNVNAEFWRGFKASAVKDGLSVGEAINLAMKKFAMEIEEKKSDKKHKEIWDLEPVEFDVPDAKHFSQNVDKLLYG